MIPPLVTQFAEACTQHSFFGLPTWYKYLAAAGKMVKEEVTGRCDFVPTLTLQDKVQNLGLIGLGLLDILLRLAGLVAVVFVIYGGIQLVTSQGDPESSKKARQTITNALIGLVIALLATAIVSFIGNKVA